MEDLIEVLKLSQQQLKIKIYQLLLEKKMQPIFEDGFLYGKGKIPVLLVAHMDTVFENPPKTFKYDEKNDRLSSIYGIGGDDRCGVYAILKILTKYKPHVLFTEDEEAGCIGVKKAINSLKKPNVKYIIELDHRGGNDCIFYNCNNDKFISYIESFGFITSYGTYSDVSLLGVNWNIASVNLSCGYYNEHFLDEYIVLSQLEANIKCVEKMLIDAPNIKNFSYYEEKKLVKEKVLKK